MTRKITTQAADLLLVAVAVLASLSACNGGDDDIGITTIAETTAVMSTSEGSEGSEVTGATIDATTDATTSTEAQTTGSASETGGVEACARMAWLHPNPPMIPGTGGPEFFRTIGVDLAKCEASHDIKIAVAPEGDSAFVLALGVREPSCVLIGGPAAVGVENVDYPLGLSSTWISASIALFVDDALAQTIELPKMVAPDEQAMLGEDLGARAFFEAGGLWHLAPVGDLPHC